MMKQGRYLTQFLQAVLITCLLSLTACKLQPEKQPKHPNILWILAEDLSQDLGCYGNTIVRTPVLDSMARLGLRFTNVFTAAPVCTPSRTALATGMYQTAINAHHMRYPDSLKNQLPDSVLPLNEILRRHGYQTANIKDRPGTGKTDWSFKSENAAYDFSKWNEINPEQPFFAVVNLRLTHRPFEHDSIHPIDPNIVRLPPYYPDHIVAKKDYAAYYESVQLMDGLVAMVLDEIRKRGWSDNTIVYFFGDHGQPFTRAKTFCYDSGLKIPLIINCPENLEWSAYLPSGSVNTQLISAIDITATTLSMAGIEKPAAMQGRVILGPSREPERSYVYSASDRIGEIFFKSRTVRSARFRYIRNFNRDFSINTASTAYKKAMHPIYQLIDILAERDQLDSVQKNLVLPTPEEELYDIQNDPFETVNLAGNPAYTEVLDTMKMQLKSWQDQNTDYGMLEDSPDLQQAFIEYGEQAAKSQASKAEKLRQDVLNDMSSSKN